jgi:hypothetical protein
LKEVFKARGTGTVEEVESVEKAETRQLKTSRRSKEKKLNWIAMGD